LSDIEAEVKNWVTDHRNKGISVCTKVIISEARRWAVTHSLDFVDSLVLHIYEKRHEL
jgi:hypothetical protein